MHLALFICKLNFQKRPIAVLPFGVPTLVGLSVIKELLKQGLQAFLCMSDGCLAVCVMLVLVLVVIMRGV